MLSLIDTIFKKEEDLKTVHDGGLWKQLDEDITKLKDMFFEVRETMAAMKAACDEMGGPGR